MALSRVEDIVAGLYVCILWLEHDGVLVTAKRLCVCLRTVPKSFDIAVEILSRSQCPCSAAFAGTDVIKNVATPLGIAGLGPCSPES